MTTLSFWVYSPKDNHQQLSYSGHSIEDCFETLTGLVRRGWQPTHIELLQDGATMTLPVDAFDGVCLTKPLRQIEQELEYILC